MTVSTTPPPQGLPSTELGEAAADLVTDSGTRLIEFSVIGGAFVFVFVFCAILVWFVLRAAAREIRDARVETANANSRSMQVSEKAVGNVAIMNERLTRIIDMSNDLLTLLHLREGRRKDDSPDPTQDG